jgi:hypothetical protein
MPSILAAVLNHKNWLLTFLNQAVPIVSYKYTNTIALKIVIYKTASQDFDLERYSYKIPLNMIVLTKPHQNVTFLCSHSPLTNILLDNLDTVKPVYKGHSREPENVVFMSRCPLYTG